MYFLHLANCEQVPQVKGIGSYPHMPIIRLFAARLFVRFWASGGAKFPKMGDSLPRTPINLLGKFGAASFIIAGETRNRTNTQKANKQTNKQQTIHTLPIGTC